MTTTNNNNTVSFNEFATTPELFVGTESCGQLHRDYNFCNLLLNQVTATGNFFQSLRDGLERYRSLSAKQFKCVLNQLVKEGVDLGELIDTKWVDAQLARNEEFFAKNLPTTTPLVEEKKEELSFESLELVETTEDKYERTNVFLVDGRVKLYQRFNFKKQKNIYVIEGGKSLTFEQNKLVIAKLS